MKFKAYNMTTETVLITPNIAQEMLVTNANNNRKINHKWVETLAEAMMRGTFKLTAQGIAFAKDGTLIDGQHRLCAVVKSGIPCEMRVTYGCEKDSFDVLDIGKKRTTKDIAVINRGEEWERSPLVISAFDTLMHRRSPSLYKNLTPGEIFEIIRNNSNLARVFYGCCVARKMSVIDKGHRGALLEALAVTKDVDALFNIRNAWEFLQIDEGRKYAENIVHAFRNRIMVNKAKRISINRMASYNLMQNVFFIFASGKQDAKVAKNTANDRYCVGIQSFMNGKYDDFFRNVYVGDHVVKFG